MEVKGCTVKLIYDKYYGKTLKS